MHMDAANVDLKAFTETFYHEICSAHLEPVLDTLKHIKQQTNTWLEITTLIIPGFNDSDRELSMLTGWIFENLGPDVPLHFTAFHPAYKMMDVPPTSVNTLVKARRIGLYNGLHYVYTGNVRDREGSTTFCHSCKREVIVRDPYSIEQYHLSAEGKCRFCGAPCAGVFGEISEDWGAKRVPILI